MPESDTQLFRKNPFNAIMLVLYRCMVMAGLGLIGYLGKYEFESTKADIQRLANTTGETQLAVVRLEGRVASLESSVKENINRSEFMAALSARDQELKELRNELQSIRRHVSTAPPHDIKP